MSHESKAKAKGISASSFFDLKAELSKQEADFAKSKSAGNKAIVGGVKRPDKKPTVWARQNKGVAARATRDVELEAVSRPTLESARAVLERKAKIYEKLRKGKTGGLNDAQYNALLVDFDSGAPSLHYESDSDDLDESLTVPKRPEDDDDPVIEYEDEFGRVRTARRSEVPRHLVPPESDQDDPIIEYEDEFGRIRTSKRSEVPRHLWPKGTDPDSDEDIVIYNPVGHFPVYEPSAERVAEIEKAHSESANPLSAHYDAAKEVRAKGAGFYQFSADEETRKAQMEELKSSRMETEKARREAGAVDLKPGEMEGMRDDEMPQPSGGPVMSRAMEKRKRELEERKKLIEAKRRKTVKEVHPEGTSTPKDAIPKPKPPLASVHKKPEATFSAPVDPFAVLEAKVVETKSTSAKGKAKAQPVGAADAFLSQLEQELLSSKQKKRNG